mmetsp:Transcript_11527/g.16909  ORF Transcript_11527/g.16909 Transcript_11527/m.16909 type:complete len:102 (-) Transcript_11527:83-388(-)
MSPEVEKSPLANSRRYTANNKDEGTPSVHDDDDDDCMKLEIKTINAHLPQHLMKKCAPCLQTLLLHSFFRHAEFRNYYRRITTRKFRLYCEDGQTCAAGEP